MEYYAKEVKEIFKEFNTSEKGLSQNQFKDQLKIHGKNILKKIHKLQPLKIFFSQFKSFLIYILLIATGVSFLIGHLVDALVILVVVFVNAIIGFFQQYKAEKVIIGLKKLLVQTSKVIRDGKYLEISSSQIVPGDILFFNAGDKVNADCRIFEYENLETNEAALTGESLPISKDSKKLIKDYILAERKNMLYAGTQIVRGSAKAIVIATGMKSEFGKIASKLQEIEIQNTPMQKRLDVFSKQMGAIIITFVGLVMLLGALEKFDFVEMFLTAIALAVSAIPEGLPAVLAMAFAISSKIMSRKNVIIRKLPAVESLGSVTVICTDKTGTLTEEKMTVQEIFSNNLYLKKDKKLFYNKKEINYKDKKSLDLLLKTSLLCNNARFESTKQGYSFLGDPTEEALVRLGLDLEINKKLLSETQPRLKEFEFDSKRKMMSVLRNKDSKKILYSKGAIEKILELSSFEFIEGKIKELTPQRKKFLREQSKKMETKSLRVIAFAYREFSIKEQIKEKDLTFLGFVGMIDPPRKEVREAIKQAKDAGIKIKMITGDSLLTAVAIAEKVGIIGKSITGKELEKMSDASLMDSIDKIGVFARTSPHQKLRIAKILQQKGEIVAMTGDGINDVLALKSADIGIAMGIRGTDVARDVADVVLVDDNFASIIEGVKQGRKTYDNIKKFTKYFLSVNFSEIFLILIALILGILYGTETWFLPLLPLQILWINLITDSFPALALAFEKQENVMKTKPRKEKSILSGIWKFVLIGGIITFAMKFMVYLIGMNSSFSIEQTRTMVLTTAVLFEVLFVYACRSSRPLFDIGVFSNKWLNYAVLLALVLHFILLYTPISSLFSVVALDFTSWLIILPFALSGVIIFELAKFFKKIKK